MSYNIARGIERQGQENNIALSLRQMHKLAINDVRGPMWREAYTQFYNAYQFLNNKGNPLAGIYKRIQERLFRAALSEGTAREEWLQEAEQDMIPAGLRVDKPISLQAVLENAGKR